MYNTPKLVIAILEIDGKQVTVSMVHLFDFSGVYEILVDKVVHGEARNVVAGRWSIYTHPDSIIKEEHHQALNDALINAETQR
jgi:hypothetical protein